MNVNLSIQMIKIANLQKGVIPWDRALGIIAELARNAAISF